MLLTSALLLAILGCAAEDSAEDCPGRTDEVCDGEDNDCDGFVDEDPTDGLTLYLDADDDGFGDDTRTFRACEVVRGLVEVGGDCRDDWDDVNPGAEEKCDGDDNNCDGLVDDESADPKTMDEFYRDDDGDGWGDSATLWTGCSGTADEAYTWVESYEGDCAPDDPTVYPGAPELCDDIVDADCDGFVNDCPATPYVVGSIDGVDAPDGFGRRLQVVGDVDGDGGDDLLVTTDSYDYDAADAYIVPAEVSGVVQLLDVASATIEHGAGTYPGALGDVDGDGAVDVGMSGSSRGVLFWRGPATGSLTEDNAFATLGLAYAFDASADLDGDGLVDVLAGNSGYDSIHNDGGAVFLYLGPILGDRGTDEADSVVAGADSDHAGAVDGVTVLPDLDGDGLPDIAVGATNYGDHGAVGVFAGLGAGQRDFASADAMLEGEEYSAADTSVSVGDLDGDGNPDLGVVSTNDGGDDRGGVVVFAGPFAGVRGTHDAEFIFTTSTLEMGARPLVSADLDGDGALDLAVGTRGDQDGSRQVAVFSAPAWGEVDNSDATIALHGESSMNDAPALTTHQDGDRASLITTLEETDEYATRILFLRLP